MTCTRYTIEWCCAIVVARYSGSTNLLYACCLHAVKVHADGADNDCCALQLHKGLKLDAGHIVKAVTGLASAPLQATRGVRVLQMVYSTLCINTGSVPASLRLPLAQFIAVSAAAVLGGSKELEVSCQASSQVVCGNHC